MPDTNESQSGQSQPTSQPSDGTGSSTPTQPSASADPKGIYTSDGAGECSIRMIHTGED